MPNTLRAPLRGPSRLALVALVAAALAASADPLVAQDPFQYDRAAEAYWREQPERVDSGVAILRISFESPLGGLVTGRMYVPAHQPGTRLPVVLRAHGAPGSSATSDGFGIDYARRGALVVAIDAAFARRDPQAPLSFTPRDSVEQLQTLLDYRRLVDLLVQRPDVDSARIGYVGVSYGAAVGGALAGIEPRIAAFVLAVGDLGIVSHFVGADGRWMPPLSDMPPDVASRWARAMHPVSGTALFPKANGERLFLQNNREDQAVLPHVAEAFHKAAPRGTTIKWYPGGHRLGPAHWQDQAAFLHERIGISLDLAPVAP